MSMLRTKYAVARPKRARVCTTRVRHKVTTQRNISLRALFLRALRQANRDDRQRSSGKEKEEEDVSESKERFPILRLPQYAAINTRKPDFLDAENRKYYAVNKDSFPSLYQKMVDVGMLGEGGGEGRLGLLVLLPVDITRKEQHQEFPRMENDTLSLIRLTNPARFNFNVLSAHLGKNTARGLLTVESAVSATQSAAS